MLNAKFGDTLLITLGDIAHGKKMQYQRTFRWWIALVDFIGKHPKQSGSDWGKSKEIRRETKK